MNVKIVDIDEFYEQLDPGVRDLVRMIRAHEFFTTDSGDGCSKPEDQREFGRSPHVVCAVPVQHMLKESHRLQLLLPARWFVQASYSTADRTALLIAMGPDVA